MVHHIKTYTDEKSIRTNAFGPFTPDFPKDEVAQAVKLEIWGSDYDEPGGDYCEFRLIGKDGVQISAARVSGY